MHDLFNPEFRDLSGKYQVQVMSEALGLAQEQVRRHAVKLCAIRAQISVRFGHASGVVEQNDRNPLMAGFRGFCACPGAM